MITPRTTSLVRAADLAAFRDAVVTLACGGAPLDARDRLVIVPTRAAAAHLVRTIEARLLATIDAVVLPDLVTVAELVPRLGDRISIDRPLLGAAEREVLLGVSCRAARDSGVEPPFRLRPGLIAEILRFYDELQKHHKDIDAFGRLALGRLEPGADYDRGAARLVQQTRFLVAAFRDFEHRCGEHGLDEHALRRILLEAPAPTPVRHIVVTVADRAFDPHGLTAAHWDLLARLPGVTRLDVVVTDTTLAGALHERIHELLPGIEEVRAAAGTRTTTASLLVPRADAVVHTARDREEEVAGFARRVKRAARSGEVTSLDRAALVVHQPLPYVYLARDVLRSAGIPYQMFDALPLAAEPYAAALDLVFACLSASFSRAASIALLRSPHFRFEDEGGRLSTGDVAALDRALSEAGYLGELESLESLIAKWRDSTPVRGHLVRALRAAHVLADVARTLAPLREAAPVAGHLDRLILFLTARENLPGPDDPLRMRQLRARSAVFATLVSLRDAYARFDATAVHIDQVAALVRRWIEGQTFAPRVGDGGVHLVDAASARFGDFDLVQIAGLVDGEWPDHPRRSIFYSAGVLRDLGWPVESDRLDGARGAFRDLLQLPSSRLIASTFSLEADTIVAPSTLLDDVVASGLPTVADDVVLPHIFEYEGLATPPADVSMLDEAARVWAELRLQHAGRKVGPAGFTEPHVAAALSLSALERYQDCPFKFFASDVLRLEEAPEDETTMSPRARGRFIHELFQRFFAAWDERGDGTITSDRIDAARELFSEVAAPLLARLPEAEAALERTRLFGSAISVGLVDVVLGLEASRPVSVQERWLEYRLEGAFSLGVNDGTRVALKGVADRIDLLAGNRLRVIDYKSGSAPNAKRALQVPIYALCAQERLNERGGEWTVDEASYVAFTGKRTLVHIVKPGGDPAEPLGDARKRVLDVLAGIARGEFPPRPHDPAICRYCAYSAVCRKDYVDDE